MTYQEATELAEGLRERFHASFSASDKETIKRLYSAVLGKELRVTSCQRCYHDAVIEITLKLRKTKTMAQEMNYRLKAGAIIMCPDFHNGQIYTNDNLTDEVAAEYLGKFPTQANLFSKIPEKPVLNASDGAKADGVGNLPQDKKKPAKTKKAKK